ncbi:acetyl-CoA carboxylase biotin carboxylase subunit family protein [Streptomyces sp. NPDC017435]|uniref:acetyl-CoA carboxylase biotin carboxylase subunit family protein n=1 Tax=Streptomyces sp. NPDC017435 TaxID=3364995 RepID=UPI003790EC22
MPRPVITVVYDFGSVAPADIVDRLEPLADVVLAVCRSAHTEQVAPLLADLAPVVAVEGDSAAALDKAASLLTAHRPDAVLTFSERRLATTAELAARLGLPYHDADTVRLLTDKYEQRRRLRERGVDPVRTRLLRTPRDWAPALAAVGLPAVLKPVRGEGSRSTHPVRDADTGAALTAELLAGRDGENAEEALVLEEYLAGVDRAPFGDHVSVESAVVDGRVTHWAVTGKFPLAPPFREVGHYWPAPLDDAERAAVLDLAGRAVEALGLRTGITHTEVKLTAQGPRLIEVNGRLGGFQSGLGRLAGGLDPVALAGRIALGGPAPGTWAPQERVVYARAVPAPAEGGLLMGVQGVADALAVPGLDGYETRVRPGTRIPPGVGTAELAVLWGTADDHRAMLADLDRALDALTYTFADAPGAADTHTVRARDLAGHGPLTAPDRRKAPR